MQIPRGPLIFKHRYLQVNTAFSILGTLSSLQEFFFSVQTTGTAISYVGYVIQYAKWISESKTVRLVECLSPNLVHSVSPKSTRASVEKGDLWGHQNCTTPDRGTVSPQSKSEGFCQSLVLWRFLSQWESPLWALAGNHLLLQQQTLNYRIQFLLWELIPICSLCLLAVSNVLMT